MGKGGDSTGPIVAVVGGCCCVLLIVGIILIITSFSSLEPNEMGVEFNSVQQEINTEELFTAGRHFLGVGHSFIVYPQTLQTVKFAAAGGDGPAITARTKDGLVVNLDVSFNFKLKQSITEMSQLYLDFGEFEEVKVSYNRIARNWVRVTAAEFTAFEFFFNRTQIQTRMLFTLDRELNKAHGSVDALQLLSIDLPSAFDAARTRQETAVQEIEQRQREKNVAQIQADTQVARAQEEAQVILFEANAKATQIKLGASAQVEAVRARFAAERESYVVLAKEIGLTPSELLSYIWLDAVQEGLTNSIIKLPLPALVGTFGN